MSQLTDGTIGELLGQLYVQKHFKPEAKARMDEMIANLIKAYEIRIKGLDWMGPETKEKALAKLYTFRPKVGYPEKWKTYDGLEDEPQYLLPKCAQRQPVGLQRHGKPARQAS